MTQMARGYFGDTNTSWFNGPYTKEALRIAQMRI
jgi:hypothetical protein